jgi:hypothetical protein
MSNVGFLLLILVLAGELAYAVWPAHKASVSVEAASVGVATTDPHPPAAVTPTTVRKIIRATPRKITVRTSTTTRPAVTGPVIAPGSVTYTVAAGTVVRVMANGKCWIQARQGVSGPELDDVILKAGEVRTYTAPLWLRIGNTTHVTVSAGSTELQLPPTTGNLTINPA